MDIREEGYRLFVPSQSASLTGRRLLSVKGKEGEEREARGGESESMHGPPPVASHSFSSDNFASPSSRTPLLSFSSSSSSSSLLKMTSIVGGRVVKPQKERRNERERKRVHQVNVGFDRLRIVVTRVTASKKLSKADTLREAARYIAYLRSLLDDEPVQGYQHEFTIPSEPSMMYSPSSSFYSGGGYHSSDSSPMAPSSFSPPPPPSSSQFASSPSGQFAPVYMHPSDSLHPHHHSQQLAFSSC